MHVGDARGITVAVAVIGRAAGAGDGLVARETGRTARRLRRGSGFGGCGRVRGIDDAAGRGRAGVLDDPEGDRVQMLGGDVLANVLNGRDGDGFAVGAFAVGHRLAAGVDARAIGGCGDSLRPREQVSGLFVEQAATFFLIEEEDGPGGKPSRRAAATAASASARASAAGDLPDFCARRISWSQRPSARTRKPKPLCTRMSRLPIQGLLVGRGGLVSQYPVKENCLRKAGSSASPG